MRVKLNLSYNLSKSIPVLIPLPSPLMRLSDYRLITCKNPTTDPVMRYPGLFTESTEWKGLTGKYFARGHELDRAQDGLLLSYTHGCAGHMII